MRKKNAYRRNICYSLTNKNASVGTKNCFISVLARRQIFLSEELAYISIKKNWHLEFAPKHFVGMHTLTHVLTTCWLSSAGGLGKNPFLRGPSTETWHIKRPPYCILAWLQQETLKLSSHVFVYVYFATLYTLIIFLYLIYSIVCSRLSVNVDRQRADAWKMAIQTGRKNWDHIFLDIFAIKWSF